MIILYEIIDNDIDNINDEIILLMKVIIIMCNDNDNNEIKWY